MTSRKATPAPEAKAEESESKATKVRASDVLEDVFTAIQKTGAEGISLKALEEATGLRYRVLHNVVWHLGENPKLDNPRIKRVGEGRKLVFAAIEAKPKTVRKPRTRKAPAKAAGKAPAKAA